MGIPTFGRRGDDKNAVGTLLTRRVRVVLGSEPASDIPVRLDVHMLYTADSSIDLTRYP
jgi:hypothetical protein